MTLPPAAYPAFLDLRNRLVVIVGDGSAAERKAKSMLKYGADVAVIGPEPTAGLVQAEAEGLLTLERRPYAEGDAAGAFLVICVDPDQEVQLELFSERDSGCRLVSSLHAPESSNFSTPSVVRHGSLQIAISTAGRAPEVAHQIRAAIREEFGEEWGEYVQLMAELRDLVAERLPIDERAPVLEAAAGSNVPERIRDGRALDAEALFKEFAVADAEPESSEEAGE